MHITILETDSSSFFKRAQSIESLCPKGHWRYFKLIDAKNVLGVFESEASAPESLKVNENFFKYFLGTFSPSTSQTFELIQAHSFSDFCTTLNSLLNDNRPVYDLSVSKKWIWTDGDKIQIPTKLNAFLN